ncbi:MAG: hypothetical protein ACK5N8_06420 [Alphaproteobacteria bacterium]
MANGLKLKIHLPAEVFRDVVVDKVQIPSVNGVMTILSERAPGVFILGNGVIRTLNEKNEIVEKFFVKSGVVEQIFGVCKIMVESIIEYNLMTIEEAQKQKAISKLEEDKKYYEFIEKTLKESK